MTHSMVLSKIRTVDVTLRNLLNSTIVCFYNFLLMLVVNYYSDSFCIFWLGFSMFGECCWCKIYLTHLCVISYANCLLTFLVFHILYFIFLCSVILLFLLTFYSFFHQYLCFNAIKFILIIRKHRYIHILMTSM